MNHTNTDKVYFHNAKYRAGILYLELDSLVILHMLAWPNCPIELQEESNFQAQLLNQLRKILLYQIRRKNAWYTITLSG